MGQFGECIATVEGTFISLSYGQSEKWVTNCRMRSLAPRGEGSRSSRWLAGWPIAVTGDRRLAWRSRTRECSPSIQAWIALGASTGCCEPEVYPDRRRCSQGRRSAALSSRIHAGRFTECFASDRTCGELSRSEACGSWFRPGRRRILRGVAHGCFPSPPPPLHVRSVISWLSLGPSNSLG